MSRQRSGLRQPGPGNVQNHSYVRQRLWEPLQTACGMVDEAGQAKYGFHKLRHVAASLFIAHLGWTPKRLQEVMGHASITITFDLCTVICSKTEKAIARP